jgi:hypothetical protein
MTSERRMTRRKESGRQLISSPYNDRGGSLRRVNWRRAQKSRMMEVRPTWRKAKIAMEEDEVVG